MGIQVPTGVLLGLEANGSCVPALLFPVSVLDHLTVVVHSDGVSALTAELTAAPGTGSSPLSRAQLLMTTIFGLSAPFVFTAGWLYDRTVQILSAPLPVSAPERMVLRTPQQRTAVHASDPGLYFMTLAALTGCVIYEGAATAFARTTIFRQAVSVPEAVLAGSILLESVRFRFGAAIVQDLTRGPSPLDYSPSSLGALTAWSLRAEQSLADTLLSFTNPFDAAEEEYIQQWGGAIYAFDPSDIPPEACLHLPTFQQDALVHTPFSYPTPVPVTRWVPRKPRQQCQRCPNVTMCSDLILPTPECAGRLDDWWRKASADFELLAQGRPLDPRRAPTVALGQNCLLPCARGCVWDCRQRGQVVPLDFEADIDLGVELSLDRDALVRDMADWPDQELRSHLAFGVRFGADLPLQLVLAPQLKSLAFAFERTQVELQELVTRGWYALFDHLPFIPLRMHPKGATERKLENRPRPTTDGSHPHASQGILDSDGVPVLSINHAIRTGCYSCSSASVFSASPPGAPSSPAWWKAFATWKHLDDRIPHEYKPDVSAVARDSSILSYPARCVPDAPQPIYTFVDDFRNYFSQVPIASEDLWQAVVATYSHPHLLPVGAPRLLFVSELRLGFGISLNSNVCQRLSNFIIHQFLTEFRSLDRAYDHLEPPCVQEWLAHRRALALSTGRYEDMLLRAHIYTDDPLFICVGAARALRALRLWRTITSRYRLLMAIPQKRKIGTMVPWLGFLPAPSHGLLAVKRDKLLRAVFAIRQALHHRLHFDQYRSLLGFLVHLRVLVPRPKLQMYALYRPLQAGHEIDSGPATLVRVDPDMHASLSSWLRALSTIAAAPMTYALPRARHPLLPGACFFLSSDAAKDGASTPSIAGYLHGFFWSFPYPSSWTALPIAALEFLALAVSIILFAPFLDHAATVVLETDSLTSALVLGDDAARSPYLVAAHALLLAHPSYARLLAGVGAPRRVVVTHLYGAANVAADCLSRGHLSQFFSFCSALGVRPQHIPLSRAAWRYLRGFVRRVAPFLPLELTARGRSPAAPDYDLSLIHI